jgi:iron complex outermembrane receptor protein
MPLPGGPLKVSVGADVRRERLSFQPSLFAQGLLADPSTGALALAPDVANVPVDTAALMQPATASRYVWGAFTEWLAPVTSTWDLGAAVRSDHDSMSGDAVTGKVLTRWKLSPGMLWRASLGTGFKAPTLNQLSVPTQSFYMDKPKCTSALQGAQGSLGLSQCLEPSIVSVPVLATSNSALKPEHSLQGSLGLKIEPIAGHTVGFDIWAVQIHDRIGTVSPDTIYANPAAYPDLVTTAQTSNGLALAVLTKPINFQSRLTRGMDVEAGVMRGSPLGLIDSQLRLTTIYRDDAQAYPGGPWVSSIGDAADQGATLKWRGSWRTSLIHAGWTNTLTMRYQSGYLAKGITAYPLDQSGQTMAAAETIRLKVSGQVLWDWQTSWQISSVLQVTAGVVNVFDTKPPLALNSVDGANKGQQIGYDERYFDPRGRMLMLEAKLSF